MLSDGLTKKTSRRKEGNRPGGRTPVLVQLSVDRKRAIGIKVRNVVAWFAEGGSTMAPTS
jgi:hypothetical protein